MGTEEASASSSQIPKRSLLCIQDKDAKSKGKQKNLEALVKALREV